MPADTPDVSSLLASQAMPASTSARLAPVIWAASLSPGKALASSTSPPPGAHATRILADGMPSARAMRQYCRTSCSAPRRSLVFAAKPADASYAA